MDVSLVACSVIKSFLTLSYAAGAKAFLSRVNATILALAPHTVLVASKAVQFMSLPHPPPVRLFVPVFPIKDASAGCQTQDDCNTAKSEHRTFLLQGLFQSHRCPCPSKYTLDFFGTPNTLVTTILHGVDAPTCAQFGAMDDLHAAIESNVIHVLRRRFY